MKPQSLVEFAAYFAKQAAGYGRGGEVCEFDCGWFQVYVYKGCVGVHIANEPFAYINAAGELRYMKIDSHAVLQQLLFGFMSQHEDLEFRLTQEGGKDEFSE